MFKTFIRRLLFLPLALALVNFLGFAYAHYGHWVQSLRNPLISSRGVLEPILPVYWDFIKNLYSGNAFLSPGLTLQSVLAVSIVNSLGLLGIAFGLSLVIGLSLGLLSVNVEPPRVTGWMIPISTVGLAMPSFFIGGVLITASVFYILNLSAGQHQFPFPIYGFGWDKHLVFPVIALTVRPVMQIALTTATLLATEFRQQYVSVARSFGYSWRLIRWKTALRNIITPVILTTATSLRLMVGELILVENLFGWPGIGYRLATASSSLDPALVSSILTVVAAFFLLIDLTVFATSRLADPRLRLHSEEPSLA